MKKRLLPALILNLVLVVTELIGVWLSMGLGWQMFQYYTQDSNFFALFASGMFVVFAVRALICGREIPQWVYTLRYLATCCLTLTFTVVVAVLIPMNGPSSTAMMLTGGSMLYHHTLCPLLAIATLLLAERRPARRKKELLYAMVPTLAYAVVVIILNLTRTLRGPYPFLYVYEQPAYLSVLWCIVILGMALLFAWLLWLARAPRKSSAVV